VLMGLRAKTPEKDIAKSAKMSVAALRYHFTRELRGEAPLDPSESLSDERTTKMNEPTTTIELTKQELLELSGALDHMREDPEIYQGFPTDSDEGVAYTEFLDGLAGKLEAALESVRNEQKPVTEVPDEEAPHFARVAAAHAPLVKLFETVRELREEQISDGIFGGTTSEKKRGDSQVYASRIAAAANKIDDLLQQVEDALEGERS
jgi:hypothetical protein